MVICWRAHVLYIMWSLEAPPGLYLLDAIMAVISTRLSAKMPPNVVECL